MAKDTKAEVKDKKDAQSSDEQKSKGYDRDLTPGEAKVLQQLKAEKEVQDEKKSSETDDNAGDSKDKPTSSDSKDVKDKSKGKVTYDDNGVPLTDEKGVSYHNRWREAVKKHNELLEQVAKNSGNQQGNQQVAQRRPDTTQFNSEKVINRFQELYPEMEKEQIKSMLNMVVEVSGAMVDRAVRPHIPSVSSVHVNNAKSAYREKDPKFFKKYGDEIDGVIEQIPVQARMNPQGAKSAVENAYLIVKGKHAEEFSSVDEEEVNKRVQEALKNKNKKIVDTDASVGGKRTSGGSGVKLTKAQERDRSEHNLSREAYKSILTKRQLKAEQAGKKKPMTLGEDI